MEFPAYIEESKLVEFFSNDRFPSVQFVECSHCEGTGSSYDTSDGVKEECTWCDGYGEKFFQSTLDINYWWWSEEYLGYFLLFIRWVYRDLKPMNIEYEHDEHYKVNHGLDNRPYVSGFHMATETVHQNSVYPHRVEFTRKDCPYESHTEDWKDWMRGFSNGLNHAWSVKARFLGLKE